MFRLHVLLTKNETSLSDAVNAVPAPPVTPTYTKLGCYGDKGGIYRAMPNYLNNGKGAWTIQQCADNAWTQGYEYFGLQFYGGKSCNTVILLFANLFT